MENEVKVLKGINLEIDAGEFVAVIGKSGVGKTTLLHILGCVESFDDGSYILDGRNLANLNDNQQSEIRNQKVGIVKQDFALADTYTVEENIMIPLYINHMKSSERKRRVKEVMRKTGIEELAKKEVRKLSGGQKQRVAIARAIVNFPNLILADEPTGALDSMSSAKIMDLFAELNREGRTIVIVTHDNNVAERCGRIVEMVDGVIKNDKILQ